MYYKYIQRVTCTTSFGTTPSPICSVPHQVLLRIIQIYWQFRLLSLRAPKRHKSSLDSEDDFLFSFRWHN